MALNPADSVLSLVDLLLPAGPKVRGFKIIILALVPFARDLSDLSGLSTINSLAGLGHPPLTPTRHRHR